MNKFEFQSNAEETLDQESVEEIISIDNPEEAKEFIKNHFENGERPIVTIPKEYSDAIKNGLKARSSWIPGVALIIATIARTPYLPKNQERIAIKIGRISPEQIAPRFTGPDKKFHGVVVLDGPIPPEALEEL